ncbi:MAG TPA: GLUG motif-containing protein, partial [Candidatus Pacearchaeota archaeon]|nr:GLUG motif-containing protein [Candidatus Pacearchaeota archaeon]
MNKRGLLEILAISILIFLPLTLAFSGSGEGTAGSSYNITNCTQLQEINNNLTAYYQLTSNIDCSDTINWNTGAGFIPLGNEISLFTGSFQGNNYNISGLYINNNTRDYSGLFGYVLGEVKNVRLINVNITSKEFVGGIAGLYQGSANLSNVHVSGEIKATGYVGGLTGYLEENIAILDSSSEASINSTSTYTGGLVGSSYTGTIIENSHFTGNIQSTGNYAGGIAGIFSGLRITNCYSTGNITTTKAYVGGIAGKFDGGAGATISNSNNSGNITASSSYVGGIVGLFGEGDVTNSHSTGHINGRGYVGGLFGSFGEGDIINSYATGNIDGTDDCVGGLVGEFVIGQILGSNASGNVNSSAGWYVGGLVGEFYEEWGAGYAYLISNSHATGDVQGYSQVGGLVGDFYTGNITNSYAFCMAKTAYRFS